MHIAIWIITLVALGLWTLLCWGVSAVLAIDPTWAGDLGPLIDKLPFGGVIDVWVPGWEAMLRSMLDVTQALLGWLGQSAGWLVWVVWGAGAAFMLGTGALLSMVVVLVRKSTATSAAVSSGTGGRAGA